MDLAANRPDIVKVLRDHYLGWAVGTKPLLELLRYPVVGATAELATTLTSADWLGPNGDGWGELAQPIFGGWNIEVAAAGDYAVALYLFPPDANASLDQALRNVPSRPIVGVRLLVDGREYTAPAPAGATHARFVIPFLAGEHHRLEGQFLDRTGQPLCGAFFAGLAPVNPSAP